MPNPHLAEHNRRPVHARSTQWARALAAMLDRMGVWPNQVSVSSIGIAFLGCLGLLVTARHGRGVTIGLIGFLVAMQLRVVANMIDGMLAIEGGKTSDVGDLYNDVPDRVTDSFFFVTAGYALAWCFHNDGLAWFGWLTALGAIGTAYIRLLGGSIGVDQDFSGPLAKRARMFVLSLGAAVAAIQTSQGRLPSVLLWALLIVMLGTYVTAIRRLVHVGSWVGQLDRGEVGEDGLDAERSEADRVLSQGHVDVLGEGQDGR